MPRPRRPRFAFHPSLESLGTRALPGSVVPLPDNPFADPSDPTESAYLPDVGYPYPAPVRGGDSSPELDSTLSPDMSAELEPGHAAGVSSALSPEGSGSGLPTMVGD